MAHVVHGAKATTSAQDERYTKGSSLGPRRRALQTPAQAFARDIAEPRFFRSEPRDLDRLANVSSGLECR